MTKLKIGIIIYIACAMMQVITRGCVYMRYDIQQLLAESGLAAELDFDLPLTDYADLAEGVAHIKCRIKNHGGYLELSAKTKVTAKAVCARCGEGFDFSLEFDTVRPVAKSLTDNENDDYIIADEDGYINLSDVFGEELLLELPAKYLCKEGCKGLCIKCGANLNKKNCGCNTKEIDPRLEVLKALLENG